MQRRRRTFRTAVAIALVAPMLGALAPGATSGADGTDPTYSVTGTSLYVQVLYVGGRSVALDCTDGGKLAVNGAATTLSCAAATEIMVFGGPGPDVLDLSALTADDLGASPSVLVYGRSGADDIRGPEVGAHLVGGLEADQITGGPGPDLIDGAGDPTYSGAADVIDAGAGDDQINSTAGAQIVAGPGDDSVTAATTAYLAASIDGGPDTDTFALGSPEAGGHVVIEPQGDGSIDVVDSTSSAVGLATVPAGLEAFHLTAAGGDLVSVDGLSPTVPIDLTVAGAGAAHLEVFAKGGHTKTENQITRNGFAPVAFAGFSDVVSFGVPESPEHVYVHAAAHDLNGVHLNPTAVASVAGQINVVGSQTRTGYAEDLARALVWRQGEVHRMYQSYLLRSADPKGRDLYSEQLRKGVLANSIRATLMGSTEYYRRRAGNEDKYFVAAVYHDVLNRRTDAEGGQYWRERLSHGLSRRQMAVTFLQSSEGVRSIIRYHFRDLLGRDPLPAETTAWAPAIHDQATGERNLQVALVSSDEYLARQQ